MEQQNSPSGQKTGPVGADDKTTADASPVETDPRFPSGQWEGYSLIPPQRCPQSMELRLTFHEGTISGTGRDILDHFSVVGTYSHDGRCKFEKRCDKGQVIRCDGHHVNQGRYFGVSGEWVLDEQLRERFWLAPATEQNS